MRYFKAEWPDGVVEYYTVPSLDESDIVYYYWFDHERHMWCAEVEESWDEWATALQTRMGRLAPIPVKRVTKLEVLLMTGRIPKGE